MPASSDFNPLPPRGGRRLCCKFFGQFVFISIHSLRVEGDYTKYCTDVGTNSFQSTPSAWRETLNECCSGCHVLFQSTPSAWRETPLTHFELSDGTISIHSLRVEGDNAGKTVWSISAISIHSLRVEGDILANIQSCFTAYFNPLPPRGGRLLRCNTTHRRRAFQSTPSAWRETGGDHPGGAVGIHISIHSLRVEGDVLQLLIQCQQLNFNPLPPRGGRLPQTMRSSARGTFQSTPSAWRETKEVRATDKQKHFNPLPPRGGRLTTPDRRREWTYFNPLPPRGGRPCQSQSQRERRAQFQSTPSAWRETADAEQDNGNS